MYIIHKANVCEPDISLMILLSLFTPINNPQIWGFGSTNKVTELHQTLFSSPNILEKKGLVHETTLLLLWPRCGKVGQVPSGKFCNEMLSKDS